MANEELNKDPEVGPTNKELGAYPYEDGSVTVLGPGIFASTDVPISDTIINWQGENFIPAGDQLDASQEAVEKPKEDKFTVLYKPNTKDNYIEWTLHKNGERIDSGYGLNEEAAYVKALEAKKDYLQIKIVEL